ncbi:DMT family transporter [Vibrio sp. RC27]
MTVYILLGLLNGFCIALNRILNGQLSLHYGAFRASYFNHIVGLIFLSLFVVFWYHPPEIFPSDIVLYSGGLIGALYVAINSLVMTKLGSTNAIVLVIAGQMLVSVFFDSLSTDRYIQQYVGAGLIIVGVVFKEMIEVKKKSMNN